MNHKPNVECKTIKFINNSRRENLSDPQCGEFLDIKPKAQSMKEKTDSLVFIKQKLFDGIIRE